MRTTVFLRTVVSTTVTALVGMGTAFASPISIDVSSINKVAVNSQLHAEPVHYKRRHHIHRRGFVVAPNASVTVEGSNGMASKSRTISGNGDGTWNAEGSRSITNYNTGVTCSRNGSFDSATRTGTVTGQCVD